MKTSLLFTLALALALSGCSSMKKGEADTARCSEGPFSSSGRPLWPECKSIGPGSAPAASALPPLGALPDEIAPLGLGSGASLPLPGATLPGPRIPLSSAEDKKPAKPVSPRKKAAAAKARPAKKNASAPASENRPETSAPPAPEREPDTPAPLSNAPALKAQPATEPIPGTRKVITSKGAERR